MLDLARPLRRRAALRRRRHHAGDLGARRRRRARGRQRRRSTHFVVPITVVILVRAVRGPAIRHGARRDGVRPDHARLVRRRSPRSASACDRRRRPTCSRRSIPWYARRSSSSTHGVAGFLVLGAVVLVHHRRRGALRRHGALRQAADPARLVRRRAPGAAAQLLRPGRAAAARPGGGEQSVLSARAALASSGRCSSSRPLAAIVASQALISGAFSLTQQAIQLGYSPRMQIVHTSEQRGGADLHPRGEQGADGRLPAARRSASSSSTRARRGLRHRGHRHDGDHVASCSTSSRARAGAGRRCTSARSSAAFLLDRPRVLRGEPRQDRSTAAGCRSRIAIGVFTLMTTWKRGRMLLGRRSRRGALPLDLFLDDVEREAAVRVKGTAVFMTSSPEGVPVVLLHHLKHNKVLHEQVVLLSVHDARMPEVPTPSAACTVEPLGHGFCPRRRRRSASCRRRTSRRCSRARAAQGISVPPMDTSYYLGRERLVLDGTREDASRGGRSSSRSCRATRARPPSSSRSRRTASSSSARRSSSDAGPSSFAHALRPRRGPPFVPRCCLLALLACMRRMTAFPRRGAPDSRSRSSRSRSRQR